MSIERVEQIVRDAIKARQEAGISIRNGRTAMFFNDEDRGQYWDPQCPKQSLCLLGAIGATAPHGTVMAAMILNIPLQDSVDLEAGFEDWRSMPGVIPDSPYFALGRKLGHEIETDLGFDQARFDQIREELDLTE